MHHRCNINAVAVTPGRDDSTLRDHPAFSRNITQVHKTRGMSQIMQIHKIFIPVLRTEVTELNIYWYLRKYITAVYM